MKEEDTGISGGLRKTRVFTIGHSNRSIRDFVGILEDSSTKMVVDVRSNPASVRFPHFERNQLAAALDGAGIFYRWFRALGGNQPPGREDNLHTALSPALRSYVTVLNTPEIDRLVIELIGLAASVVTVVLGEEQDPRQCHRILLSDKMEQHGVRVIHIVDKKTALIHEPHPDMSMENGKLVYRLKQLPLLQF